LDSLSAVFTSGAKEFLIALGLACPEDVEAEDAEYETVGCLVHCVIHVNWLAECLDE